MVRGMLVLVVLFALLVAPTPASATSCVDVANYDQFADATTVLDGVTLSSPGRNGVLFSPARFVVARYPKGSGKRVIKVKTAGRQINNGSIQIFTDKFWVGAGEEWRLLVRRPPSFFLEDTPYLGPNCGFGTDLPGRRILQPVAGSAVAGRGWRAEQLTGPLGTRCVAVGRKRACTRGGTALLLTHRRGSTALAIAGRGLRRLTVGIGTTAGTGAAVRPGGTYLSVFAGRVDLADLSIRAGYSGAKVRQFGASHLRAIARDAGWAADAEHPYGHGRLPRLCVTVNNLDRPGVTDGEDGSRTGACGNARMFFAVRQLLARDTLVFGAVERSVTSVIVESPVGTRRATFSRDGRAFVVALPGKVPSGSTVVRITHASGAQEVLRGRRSMNLVSPPR